MTPSISLVTPSYIKDLERFTVQRESIERCGIDLPHYALVHDEDIAAFKKIPFQQNLHILSTRDILPPKIEARRAAWGSRRRELRYWKGRPPIHGWYSQQLVKLAMPSHVRTEGILCLDSDTFFVDTITSSDFYAPDGRLHFYETDDDVDVQMAEWYAHSLRFFGINACNAPVKRTTHSPMAMHCAVITEMQQLMEKQHGKFWMEAMLDGDMIMEYATYGAYARYFDAFKRTIPVSPAHVLSYWWSSELDGFERDFVERVRTERPKMVLIHSNHNRPVSSYRDLIEQAWAIRPA